MALKEKLNHDHSLHDSHSGPCAPNDQLDTPDPINVIAENGLINSESTSSDVDTTDQMPTIIMQETSLNKVRNVMMILGEDPCAAFEGMIREDQCFALRRLKKTNCSPCAISQLKEEVVDTDEYEMREVIAENDWPIESGNLEGELLYSDPQGRISKKLKIRSCNTSGSGADHSSDQYNPCSRDGAEFINVKKVSISSICSCDRCMAVQLEGKEECVTPTGREQRIPQPTTCPPAPKKKQITSRKRKSSPKLYNTIQMISSALSDNHPLHNSPTLYVTSQSANPPNHQALPDPCINALFKEPAIDETCNH